jgi:hypothetical protein
MIGIYKDNFIDYLKKHVGDKVKIRTNNIVIPCPWCEYGKEKDHYHLWISIEAPIFHCFHGDCDKSGVLGKLIRFLEGHDISESFFDKDKIRDISKKTFEDKDDEKIKINIPQLEPNQFMLKEHYIRKRIKFANIPTKNLKGLIYDVFKFVDLNNIQLEYKIKKLLPFLQSNFVGFLTEHGSTVMFRNINPKDQFGFYKMKIAETNFIDYYRLPGGNPQANKIVLAEGIFDILSEQIFDTLNIKDDVRLYASVLSSKYKSLIQSIVYYEQIFRPEIIILSDRGIKMDYYKKVKKYNSHIIENMQIYYNKTGKDFNDLPLIPTKFLA